MGQITFRCWHRSHLLIIKKHAYNRKTSQISVVRRLRVRSHCACANAGSVTYDFIEGPSAPDPGTVGAFFVVASPPASATSGWSTSNAADVLELEITDPKIGPVGSYLTGIVVELISLDGKFLDAGFYIAGNAGTGLVQFEIGVGPNGTTIDGPTGEATGQFVLATVPEPSSLLLAGTASLAGLGLWARRRGR